MKTVPIYRSELTYDNLASEARRHKTVIPGLLRRCEKHLIIKPISPGSRIYQDAKGRTLAAYFGYRMPGKTVRGVRQFNPKYD